MPDSGYPGTGRDEGRPGAVGTGVFADVPLGGPQVPVYMSNSERFAALKGTVFGLDKCRGVCGADDPSDIGARALSGQCVGGVCY
jgi:hypothetical protein